MSDDLRKLAEAYLGPHDYTAQRLDAERAWQRATDPTTILALLDRVERLERAIRDVAPTFALYLPVTARALIDLAKGKKP